MIDLSASWHLVPKLRMHGSMSPFPFAPQRLSQEQLQVLTLLSYFSLTRARCSAVG